MGLLVRIYYNAVYGALGGLLGWMLYGIFGNKNPNPGLEQGAQMLLAGAFIGGFIGYLVVSVEAIRDGALVRIARLGTYGVVLGAIGGAIGMLVGDQVNYALNALLGNYFFVAMVARGLGWMVLGVAIGMSEGIAAKSLGKFSYGTLGGLIGGFIGGCLFGLCYFLAVQNLEGTNYWSNALGLVILGACIGSLSALVQAVFQPASVKVLRGWQEGREYPLERPASLLGRDEHADIALFRDMKVEKKHAIIQREGNRFLLVNNDAPPETTRVNGEPVRHSCALQDGDRIELGTIILRFQARTAVAALSSSFKNRGLARTPNQGS